MVSHFGNFGKKSIISATRYIHVSKAIIVPIEYHIVDSDRVLGILLSTLPQLHE